MLFESKLITLVFVVMSFVAFSLIVYGVGSSIKLKRPVRDSYGKIRRRERVQAYISKQVKETNESSSNFKLRTRLKVSGVTWSVTKLRVIQLVAPVATCIIFSAMYLLKVLSQGSAEFPMIPMLVVAFTAMFSPPLYVWAKAYSRREELSLEIVQFSHRLVVCIGDKVQLYHAIKRAGRTSKVLKPYIDELLIGWIENPKKAIQKFADDVAITEVLPVTNTLLATWNAPQEKIVDLFQQQIRNIDTMRDFMIKKRIEVSPFRQLFLVMLPFGVIIGLVMFPWYQELIKSMKSIF